MKCPNCGAQAEGTFCSSCGAPLKGAKCRECEAPLSAGARFCNNCGTPTGLARKRGSGASGRLPWIIAGASLAILAAVLVLPALRGSNDSTSTDNRLPLDQVSGAGAPAPAGPGPLSGTPREQADRLFNRVMMEKENGDTAQAKFFVPMAIQAYQMAGELDADGYYHLSLLQTFGGDPRGALSSAQQILSTSPNHLLALASAAQAARATGDNAAARDFYQRFVSAYDAESKTSKPEYQDHGKILPELKAEAESFLRSPGR